MTRDTYNSDDGFVSKYSGLSCMIHLGKYQQNTEL